MVSVAMLHAFITTPQYTVIRSSASYKETLPAEHRRGTTTEHRDNALTVYIMRVHDVHTDTDFRIDILPGFIGLCMH